MSWKIAPKGAVLKLGSTSKYAKNCEDQSGSNKLHVSRL